MPESLTLRIRHPQGISTIDKLSSSSTISDLKHEISTLIKSDPTELLLRVGFPPAPVIVSDETHLDDAQITTGDTIIVEVHEIEESKSQTKPISSKDSNPVTLNNPPIRTQPIITTSGNVSKKPLVNETKVPIISSKNEVTEPKKTQTNATQYQPSVSVLKQNEYLKDMPLTDDEFNQQLAKALQESISNEISNQNPNKNKMVQEDDNLFAESNSKSVFKPTTQPKQEIKANFDADIEYARKLQAEFNASQNNNRFNGPRIQPPQRRRMDMEYDSNPDFYDMTKQYNIENGLPEDSPLKDYDDYDNRNYERDLPSVVGKKIGNNDVDQDEQLQKAIQASLGGNKIDYDDIELRKILERSKNEK